MKRRMSSVTLIALIGITLAGIVGTLAVSSRLIILRSFATIEEAAVAGNTNRALSHVASEINQLSTMVIDYADWDDSYRFIRDGNRAFVETNLVDITYEKLNLNVIVFVGEDGRIVYGRGFDLVRKVPTPLPAGLAAHLAQGSLLTRHADTESAVSGMLDLPEGPLLIASRPILTSDYKGPLRGSVVMGRFLNAAAVRKVAQATHLPVNLKRIGDRDLPAGLFAGGDGRNAGPETVRVLPLGEETVAGYGLLRDIYGRPCLVVNITLPRDIYLQGRRSIRYFIVWSSVIGLASSALGYLLLGQLLLSRNQRNAALGRYRAVVTGAFEGIVLVESGTWRILEANRAFETMMGRRSGELAGLRFLDLVAEAPPDFERKFPQFVRDAARQRRELRLRRADGSPAETEISACALNQDGVDTWSLLIGDITERKQAERAILEMNVQLERRVHERTAQLEAANTELEAFSYSVSHDLRAPLRAIDGYSAVVVEEYGGRLDDKGRRLLGSVRANTARMNRLIDDLLSFSRSGSSEMRHDRLDMRELAVAAFVETVAGPEARLKIDFTVADLPEAEGDAALVRQVWVNLISNAVKYSSQRLRPVIGVAGPIEGDQVVYHVSDNGVGFDMRYAGRLFGVFQRLHPGDRFEGTGIGMALVKRIVTRHGGRVWAQAEVDKGAIFSFALPKRSA